MKKLLIDGYNLLMCDTCQIPRDWPLEQQREALIQQVEGFAARQGYHTTMVFDNQVNPARRFKNNPRLHIEFSPAGKEADDVIRQQIRRSRNNRHLTVVSSDRVIRNTAKDHGAQTLSSDDFMVLMTEQTRTGEANNPADSRGTKYNTDLDEHEVALWKSLFERGKKDD